MTALEPDRPESWSRRGRRAFVTATLAVALALVAGCSGTEGPPDPQGSAGAESSASESGGTYAGVDEPCEALDVKLFEEIVGAHPDGSDQTSKIADETSSMYCQLTFSGDSGAVTEFAIDVRSRVHADADAAVGDFENAMGLSSKHVDSMTEVEGAWQQGASLVVEGSGQYLLLVQDGNLAVGVAANVKPFESLTEKEVMKLMTGYAEQTMAELEE